jgi:hypothetical protein
MAKLMENKQMIHIASEIVVVIGLTFYFNQKNKKLMSHIEDLSQRIEEQEDLLQKHEQIIKKLVESIKQYQSEFNHNHKQRHSDYYEQPPPPQQIQMKHKKEIKPKSIVTKPVLSKPEPKLIVTNPVVSKPEPKLIVTNPVVSKPDTKVTFKEEEQPRKLRSPPKYEEEHEEEDEEEDEEDSDLDAELEEELKELVISDPVETGLKKRSR